MTRLKFSLKLSGVAYRTHLRKLLLSEVNDY